MQPTYSFEYLTVARLGDPVLRGNIERLARKNYDESPYHALGFDFGVNWDNLVAATKVGFLRNIVVWEQAEDGRPLHVVGYASYSVAKHTIFSGTTVAQLVVMYVDSSRRCAGVALPLLRAMEREAADAGADIFLFGCHADSRAARILSGRDWTRMDTIFCKALR